MTRFMVPFCAGIIFFLSCMATPIFSGEGKGSIDHPFHDKQRPSAIFAHDEHNEKAEIEECSVCHHVYQYGQKVEDESSEDLKCSDCHHVQTGFPTRPLMKAYHDLCKGCHLDNKVGPITCGECHLAE